jgi:hypothetical protein
MHRSGFGGLECQPSSLQTEEQSSPQKYLELTVYFVKDQAPANNSAYQPQANRMVERLHRHLKNALKEVRHGTEDGRQGTEM